MDNHTIKIWGFLSCLILYTGYGIAEEPLADPVPEQKRVSISIRDTSIQEVIELLSRKDHANILIGKDVTGNVSVNLYEVTLKEAIDAIAIAAGYVVEHHNGTYLILDRKDAGMDTVSGNTTIRTFKIQYSDPKVVADILTKHLSRYGKITQLTDRGLLVIEDLPEFLERIQKLLTEIDREPQQILIEAKILEVTLNDSEAFGLNWKRLFDTSIGNGSVGTSGFASLTEAGDPSAGFFFTLVNSNIETTLTALTTEGRLRTLSTPKLLSLENREAEVVIGDRIGYKVTTTTNQITTESIEFLESGVILKVTPSVDGSGRILMDIHPEVSTGELVNGIPAQKTTEVTTLLLAENGQSVFIGGLMKNTKSKERSSIPVLGRIPLLGRLFSKTVDTDVNTETVVLITPYIINENTRNLLNKESSKVEKIEELLPPDFNAASMLWQEAIK